ncbi:MAG: hypothetical protein M3P95_10790 [Actinomycetota bacterium]|nr:hypothetical protein [Actinomycetota bacterium]
MTPLPTAFCLAGTALVTLGYTVRVAFEHDRLVAEEPYGVTVPRPGPAIAVTAAPAAVPAQLHDLLPRVRQRPREAALV